MKLRNDSLLVILLKFVSDVTEDIAIGSDEPAVVNIGLASEQAAVVESRVLHTRDSDPNVAAGWNLQQG